MRGIGVSVASLGAIPSMRIQFIPADFDGPGSYRCIFPARVLKQLGHEAGLPSSGGVPPVEVDGKKRFHLSIDPADPHVDIFVLFRTAEHKYVKFVADAKKAGKLVVASTDDDDLNLPDWHPAAHAKDGRFNKKHFFTVCRSAHAVICSTPALADSYSALNPNTFVVPNYLDKQMWERQPVKDWDGLRIGWLGEPSLRSGDLAVLRPVLSEWLSDNPDVKFVSAGGEDAHDILGIPEGQRITIPGIDFVERRLHEMLRFDVGLVPLELNKFNEAKSHLKGMEYAAAGIPCIASPTPEYRRWLAGGRGGILAESADDWRAALDLLRDADLRRDLGLGARDHVRQHWIQDHSAEWEEVFFQLEPPHWMSERAYRKNAVQKPVELEGFLQEVKQRKPKVVVEIGTASGGTFHGLSLASPDDATLISLDLPGEDGFEYSGPATLEKLRGLAKPGQDVHFIHGDSHSAEALEQLEEILAGRPIDVLFIDGDHSYEGVRADFDTYAPLVDGIVGFHDIVEHTEVPCDVDRFWNEVKREYAHKEFIDERYGDWGGIGVVDVSSVRDLQAPAARAA